MNNLLFSKKYEEILEKSHIGYDLKKFSILVIGFSLIISGLISSFIFILMIRFNVALYHITWVFLLFFILFFMLIKSIPYFSLQSKKVMLESDLLYSSRHLVLKLESGSSLLNSLESVSKLKTKSSAYFKEIMFDLVRYIDWT